MKDHQNPKRNPIAKRFIFNSRNKKPEENMPNFMAELYVVYHNIASMEIPRKKCFVTD